MSSILHLRLDSSSFSFSSFSNNLKLSFCFTHEGKLWKNSIFFILFQDFASSSRDRGVSQTLEPCACYWTSMNMLLLWHFRACCHVLKLCAELFYLSFWCQKWVLCMLKRIFSLKFHLNWSFQAKFTNKTSLRTFSKMKSLSRIWTELQ